MFTGIVEAVGTVAALDVRTDGARLVVNAPALADEAPLGASVAVNGTCLTVAAPPSGGGLVFDAVRETLSRTNLGALAPGARVNLERALRADGRLDGHFVQGHVDATGRVHALERDGEDVRLRVDCPASLASLLVEKGSVAVDGVSLTLVCVGASDFEVVLVPHTLRATTLGERALGDRLNLEADVLGKYVRRYLEQVRSGAGA